MRTTETTQSTGSSSSAGFARTTVRVLAVGIRPLWSVVDAVLNGYERWRQRQALMRLDDHLLKDIGLSRVDVEAEVHKPFWKE